MIFNFYLKLFILLILLVDRQSFSLEIKGKKTIINSNEWASKWFAKNKNELISLTDRQLKFKLYQVLAKYSKIDQKIFNEILSLVLVYKKKTKFLEKALFQNNIYSIRMGK
jgi:hypothetical protein